MISISGKQRYRCAVLRVSFMGASKKTVTQRNEDCHLSLSFSGETACNWWQYTQRPSVELCFHLVIVPSSFALIFLCNVSKLQNSICVISDPALTTEVQQR